MAHDQSVYEPQRDIEQKVTHILLRGTHCDSHFHSSVEVLLVKKGRVHYVSNTHSKTLQTGECVFIPPFFSHKFYSTGPSETETVIIPSRYLKDFSALYSGKYFLDLTNVRANGEIARIFRRIERAGRTGNELLIKGLVNCLLGTLAAFYEPVPYEKDDYFMIRIAEYIEQNFKNRLDLTTISEFFGYNKYYFSKLFHRLFGCSLSSYINTVRDNYIFENRAGRSMTELIYEAGYANTSTFYRRAKSQKET